MVKNKNLIFDFDGTICDSFDINLQIINKYMSRLNKRRVDASDFRERGIEALIKDYKLSRVQIIIYILLGRREISKHIQELKTFQGLPEVLSELSKENTLGIISSNSKRNISKFLFSNNLDKYFKFILSSPSLFRKSDKIKRAIRKYKLNPNDTFYIGDEIRDIKAAREAHVKSVAVTWGLEGEKLLKENKPDYIIEQPSKLLQ